MPRDWTGFEAVDEGNCGGSKAAETGKSAISSDAIIKKVHTKDAAG
jgi:hypothetical protein